MKHVKTYEEKVTSEYWDKIKNLKDKNDPEFLELAAKQFEVDEQFDHLKYKYIIAIKDKDLLLAKVISAFLNHFHLEVHCYKDCKGSSKFSQDYTFQEIEILASFDTLKEAKEKFNSMLNYNL